MDAKLKRNFVLLGHAQSGKTTLAESILFFCKATTRKGKVEDGSTISDYSFDEIEKKHSVNLSSLFCDYQGIRIQMQDLCHLVVGGISYHFIYIRVQQGLAIFVEIYHFEL